MAISRGDIIKASVFNNLQSRVQQILGTGSGLLGYGQEISSNQVKGPSEVGNATTITAEDFNKLIDDIRRIYEHQNGIPLPIDFFQGSGGPPSFENISNSDVIGANQTSKSVDIDNEGNYSYTEINESNGFNDLVSIVNDVESEENRFTINSARAEVELLTSDIRTLPWNGSITSTIRFNFSDNDQRRHFFNAGGQIRIQGAVTDLGSGNSFLRNEKWNNMIFNPGEIQFGYSYTLNTGSNTGITLGENIGNSQLNNEYQIIFKKSADSGLYGNSYWQIEARESASTAIDFKITLVDAGPESDTDSGQVGSIEGGVSEPVTADIEFEYSYRRANDTIVTEIPSFQFLERFE